MGRLRTTGDTTLPPRCYLKAGTYYFVTKPPERRWIAVGRHKTVAEREAQRMLAEESKHQPKRPKRPKRRNLVAFPSEEKAFAALAKIMLARACATAKKQRIPCTLTLEEVMALLAESGGVCAVSGLKLHFRGIKEAAKRPWAPSLDRVVRKAGYVAGNCRIVCVAANFAMNEWGHDALLKLARAVLIKSRIGEGSVVL